MLRNSVSVFCLFFFQTSLFKLCQQVSLDMPVMVDDTHGVEKTWHICHQHRSSDNGVLE